MKFDTQVIIVQPQLLKPLQRISNLKIFLKGFPSELTCKSGKNGIFLAHSTAEKRSLAANSQMLSIPMMLFACIHWPYLEHRTLNITFIVLPFLLHHIIV